MIVTRIIMFFQQNKYVYCIMFSSWEKCKPSEDELCSTWKQNIANDIRLFTVGLTRNNWKQIIVVW